MSEADFGVALRHLRLNAGVSLRGLAEKAHCSHSYLVDLESGRRNPGPTLAAGLDAALSAGGALLRLAPKISDAAAFMARSHKFVVAHAGMAAVSRLTISATSTSGLLHDHQVVSVAHPAAGSAALHVWPHGTVVYHLVEEGCWQSLSGLARWRYDTYERDLAWASTDLTARVGTKVNADYVLSAYWVTEPAWQGSRLDTALRLLCIPRVLVGDCIAPAMDTRPTATEEALLRDGFSHDDLVSFGVGGDTALGYASWAGVVYHPIDPSRALREAQLINMELAVQALWGYCSWLARQVESGGDLQIDAQFGWRWLRGVRSRLTTARPQEASPHRSMREAILASSGLPAMLDEALTTLRETQ